MNKNLHLWGVSSRLLLWSGLAFVFMGALLILGLNQEMKHEALRVAQVKAKILLDHNLATHAYLNNTLKPAVFEATESNHDSDYFDSRWMSSTYAVRQIENLFQDINTDHYYYKECAINARTPLNEADSLEAAFLKGLNSGTSQEIKSGIRWAGGQRVFYTIHKGEVMEAPCLRCHSTPERAPAGLVREYGPSRSFGRAAGEVVSAVSIRIPLEQAYASVNNLSYRLSGSMILVLVFLFGVQHIINKKVVLAPIAGLRDRVQAIENTPAALNEHLPLPKSRELADLTQSFNTMSDNLRVSMQTLEHRVTERTLDLQKANENLQREVEERKKAEIAIRDLARFPSENPNPILRIARDGRILYSNIAGDSVLSHWNSTVGGMVPLHWRQLVTAVLEKGYSIRHEEKFKGVVYEFSLAPVKEGDYVNAYALDITDRKNMEEEVKQHAVDLENILRLQEPVNMLGKLAGGIAHDINNPLTWVQGNLSILNKHLPDILIHLHSEALSEKQRCFLEEVSPIINDALEGCERIKHTTDKFRRASGHKVKRVFDLSETLDTAIVVTRSKWKSVAAAIKPQYEVTLPVRVLGIEVDMAYLFMNLLVNAAQSIKGNGDIILKIRQVVEEGKIYAAVEVGDNGQGMPPDVLSRIGREIFSTKNPDEGTGLGLLTSYETVREHGGRIEVSSKVGEGTVFTVYVPLAVGGI